VRGDCSPSSNFSTGIIILAFIGYASGFFKKLTAYSIVSILEKAILGI
jgi:hypothetical protein